MKMLSLKSSIIFTIIFLPGLFFSSLSLSAQEPGRTVSIYRDFDDGLYGRSIYRGIIFSVKLKSFARYSSLPLENGNGLTAYLISCERAFELAAGKNQYIRLFKLERKKEKIETEEITGENINLCGGEKGSGVKPEEYLYSYKKDGIEIDFSLEKVPEEIINEIKRTYPDNPKVQKEVIDSYKSGYVIRIHKAENVYRPQFAFPDYEDVLISAALIGNDFQPLWGIHDGLDITK